MYNDSVDEKAIPLTSCAGRGAQRRDGHRAYHSVAVFVRKVVAHTGLEPVISALRGQRVNQLHQCAA